MYNPRKYQNSQIKGVESYKAETIENKMKRILNNKEPIKNELPIIYTRRTDGIQPQYDIRTDKWEIAAEAMDKVTQHKLTKREEKNKPETPIAKLTPQNNTSDSFAIS